MFKNRPPTCDIFGNLDIWWDKFWSVSSTHKVMILWKNQEKMLSIDVSHIRKLNRKKKKKSSSVNKFGGKFMDVSVLDWGVIFKIHHMMEKIWWWGMITNGLKSPNDLYLDAKSQNMSIYGGYVTLSYNIILSSGWY